MITGDGAGIRYIILTGMIILSTAHHGRHIASIIIIIIITGGMTITDML